VRIECKQKHLDSKKHVEDMMALDDTRTKLQEKKAKLAIQKGKWVEAGLEQFGLEAALAVSAPHHPRPLTCFLPLPQFLMPLGGDKDSPGAQNMSLSSPTITRPLRNCEH